VNRTVVGVSGLLEGARAALEDGVGEAWVEGEVFEYRGAHRSGHSYFKLRDRDATVSVILWRGVAARALQCELQEGMQVLAHGHFDIYAPRGTLSFVLDHVEALGATGDLARRFEELKRLLRSEGLFDGARKRQVPQRPRRVVLITGRDSAAEADVLRTLRGSCAPVHVLVRHATVQGRGAAQELVQALDDAVAVGPDVVLLARGGGSLEDLWAFNEESLVRAVAACPVPIVCAVGHETDVTLCDFAADHRAITPTAGAATLAEGWLQARERVADEGEALMAAAGDAIAARRHALDRALRGYLAQSPARRLDRARMAVGGAEQRLLQTGASGLREARRRAQQAARRIERSGPARRTERVRSRLEAFDERLQAANPLGLLQRGYAVVEVEGKEGYLRDPAEVTSGDRLHVRVAAGSVDARVE
jgi:exodeoxyribonuclease VII large subunit